MEKSPHKSYYAVIPAHVRYDKRLPLGARLLYGEITALANATGFCFAANEYFATHYDLNDRTVRRWLHALIKCRYIRVEITGKKRHIFLMPESTYVPLDDDGNPLPVKASKLPKVKKSNAALALRHRFADLCQKHFGQRPIEDAKGYVRVAFALSPTGGNLTEAQVMDLFKEWFMGDRPVEQTMSLARALSNLNITGFKVRYNIKPSK